MANRLEEIKARLAAATPEEWSAVRRHICDDVISQRETSRNCWLYECRPVFACIVEPLGLVVHGRDWQFGLHDRQDSAYIAADADLIAHSKSDLSYLIERNVELRTEADRLTAEVEQLRNELHDARDGVPSNS